jgi:hypothetical protein
VENVNVIAFPLRTSIKSAVISSRICFIDLTKRGPQKLEAMSNNQNVNDMFAQKLMLAYVVIVQKRGTSSGSSRSMTQSAYMNCVKSLLSISGIRVSRTLFLGVRREV